jgi:hypothetical protein
VTAVAATVEGAAVAATVEGAVEGVTTVWEVAFVEGPLH